MKQAETPQETTAVEKEQEALKESTRHGSLVYGGGFAGSSAEDGTNNRNPYMPAFLQQKMERAFGHDFSNVAIKENSLQAQQDGDLAQAAGNTIHLEKSLNDSFEMQHLIAHELSHIIQQRQGRVTNASRTKMSLEKEANLAADAVMSGQLAPVSLTQQAHTSISTPYKLSKPKLTEEEQKIVEEMTLLLDQGQPKEAFRLLQVHYPLKIQKEQFLKAHSSTKEIKKRFEKSGIDPFSGIQSDTLRKLKKFTKTKTGSIDIAFADGVKTIENKRFRGAIFSYHILKSLSQEDRSNFINTYPSEYGKIIGHIPHDYLLLDDFGFAKGINNSAQERDVEKLLSRLKDPETWEGKESSLARLIITVLLQAGEHEQVTNTLNTISETVYSDDLPMLQQLGFDKSGTSFSFSGHDQNAFLFEKKYRTATKVGTGLRFLRRVPFAENTTQKGLVPFGAGTGRKVKLERLQLAKMQQFMGGVVSGIRFSDNDEKFDVNRINDWYNQLIVNQSEIGLAFRTEEAQQLLPGELSLKSHLRDNYFHVYANSLPFEGMNYVGSDSSVRFDNGAFRGMSLSVFLDKWPDKRMKEESKATYELLLPELELNNLTYVTLDDTIGIGKILLKGLRMNFEKFTGHIPEWGVSFFPEVIGSIMEAIQMLMSIMTLFVYDLINDGNQLSRKSVEEASQSLISLFKQFFSEDMNMKMTFESLEIENILMTATNEMIRSVKLGTTKISAEETEDWRENRIAYLNRQLEKATAIKSEIRKLEGNATSSGLHFTDINVYLQKKRNDLKEELEQIEAQLYHISPDTQQEIDALQYLDENRKAYLALIKNKTPHELKKASKRNKALALLKQLELADESRTLAVNASIDDIEINGGDMVNNLVNNIVEGQLAELQKAGLHLDKITKVEQFKIKKALVDFTISGQGIESNLKDKNIQLHEITIPSIRSQKMLFDHQDFYLDGREIELKNLKINVDIDIQDDRYFEATEDQTKIKAIKLKSIKVDEVAFKSMYLQYGETCFSLFGKGEGTSAKIKGVSFIPGETSDKITVEDLILNGNFNSSWQNNDATSGRINVNFSLNTEENNENAKPLLDLELKYDSEKKENITAVNPDVNIPDFVIDSVDFSDKDGKKSHQSLGEIHFKGIALNAQTLFKNVDSNNVLSSIKINNFNLQSIETNGWKSNMTMPDNQIGPLLPKTFSEEQLLEIMLSGKKDLLKDFRAKEFVLSSTEEGWKIRAKDDFEVGVSAFDFSDLSFQYGSNANKSLSLLPQIGPTLPQFNDGKLNLLFNGLRSGELTTKIHQESYNKDYSLSDFSKQFSSVKLEKPVFDGSFQDTRSGNNLDVGFFGSVDAVEMLDDEIKVSGVRFDKISAHSLDFKTSDESVVLSNDGSDQPLVLQGLKIDATLSLDKSKKITGISLDKLDVEAVMAHGLKGQVEVGSGKQKTKHIIDFPAQWSIIHDLQIKGVKLDSAFQMSNFDGVQTGAFSFAKGFQYQMADMLKLTFQKATGKSASVGIIKGGIDFNVQNLLAEGTFEYDQDKTHAEGDFDLNAKFLGASIQQIGNETIIKTQLDIPKFSMDQFFFDTETFRCKFPENKKNPVVMKNLKGKITITQTPLNKSAQAERRKKEIEIRKKYSDSKGKSTQLQKDIINREISRIFVPSNMKLFFEDLQLESIEGRGAEVYTRSSTTTLPADKWEPSKDINEVKLKLDENESLSLRGLNLKAFTVSSGEDGKMIFQTSTNGHAGWESLNIPFESVIVNSGHYRYNIDDDPVQINNGSLNLKPIFSTGKVSFTGDSRNLFDLTIDSPKYGLTGINSYNSGILDMVIGSANDNSADAIFSGILTEKISVKGNGPGDVTIIMHNPLWDNGFIRSTVFNNLNINANLTGTFSPNRLGTDLSIRILSYDSGAKDYIITTTGGSLEIPLTNLTIRDLQNLLPDQNATSDNPIVQQGPEQLQFAAFLDFANQQNWTEEYVWSELYRIMIIAEGEQGRVNQNIAPSLWQICQNMLRSGRIGRDFFNGQLTPQMQRFVVDQLMEYRLRFTGGSMHTYAKLREYFALEQSYRLDTENKEWLNYMTATANMGLFNEDALVQIVNGRNDRNEIVRRGLINVSALVGLIRRSFDDAAPRISWSDDIIGDLDLRREDNRLLLHSSQIQDIPIMTFAYDFDQNVVQFNGEFFVPLNILLASVTRDFAETHPPFLISEGGFGSGISQSIKESAMNSIFDFALTSFFNGLMNPRLNVDLTINTAAMVQDGVNNPLSSFTREDIRIRGGLTTMNQGAVVTPVLAVDNLITGAFNYSKYSIDVENANSTDIAFSGSGIELTDFNFNIFPIVRPRGNEIEMANGQPNIATNEINNGNIRINDWQLIIKTRKLK